MSYATVAQLKALLEGTDVNAEALSDDTLRELLEEATTDIDNFVHRSFQPWEGVRYFDGAHVYSGQIKRVRIFPDDILSVSEIDLADHNGNFSTVLSSYLLYDKDGRLNGFPKTVLTPGPGIYCLADNIPGGVKITGVFGYGDGKSATPYILSGDTVQDDLAANAVAITVTNAALFSPGMFLRIGSEQFYVTAVTTSSVTSGTPPVTKTVITLTVQPGQNGTIPAIHVKTTSIYIYQYPTTVVKCCKGFALEELEWRDKHGLQSERIADYSYTKNLRDYTELERYVVRMQ